MPLTPQAWAAPEGLLHGLAQLSQALLTAPAQARLAEQRMAGEQRNAELDRLRAALMRQDLDLKPQKLAAYEEQIAASRENTAATREARQQKQEEAEAAMFAKNTGLFVGRPIGIGEPGWNPMNPNATHPVTPEQVFQRLDALEAGGARIPLALRRHFPKAAAKAEAAATPSPLAQVWQALAGLLPDESPQRIRSALADAPVNANGTITLPSSPAASGVVPSAQQLYTNSKTGQTVPRSDAIPGAGWHTDPKTGRIRYTDPKTGQTVPLE